MAYSETGTMTRDKFIQNLDASIDAMHMRENKVVTALAPMFHSVDLDAGLSYVETSLGSELGMMVKNDDTENLPIVSPPPGFKKTFTLSAYRLGIRVTDTLLRADRQDNIREAAMGLVKSGITTLERNRAAVIAGGFSADTTATADGIALFSASHVLEDQKLAATSGDNLQTGALSYTTLQAARLKLQKIVNAIGEPYPTAAVTLVIPPDLEQVAQELINSQLRADVDLNAKTVLVGSIKIVVSHYLGLSSTTAWYLFGDKSGQAKGLREYYLLRPSIADVGDATADVPISKRIKAIFEMGAYDWRNVVGSAGT